MGKAPAFQFYIRDWLSDPLLKMASFSTKGIWMDILCFMWEAPQRGIIAGTKEQLSRMVGANDDEFNCFLGECEKIQFCDICVTDNGKITLCNRRMYRDEKQRKNNRFRQQKHREKYKHNGKITPPSSSSSSSSTTKNKKNTSFKENEDGTKTPFYLTKKKKKLTGWKLETFELFWDTFGWKFGKAPAADSWLEIVGLTEKIAMEIIIPKADIEAKNRQLILDKGNTPKWAQGWLSDKRWEDEITQTGDTLKAKLIAEGKLTPSGAPIN